MCVCCAYFYVCVWGCVTGTPTSPPRACARVLTFSTSARAHRAHHFGGKSTSTSARRYVTRDRSVTCVCVRSCVCVRVCACMRSEAVSVRPSFGWLRGLVVGVCISPTAAIQTNALVNVPAGATQFAQRYANRSRVPDAVRRLQRARLFLPARRLSPSQRVRRRRVRRRSTVRLLLLCTSVYTKHPMRVHGWVDVWAVP